MMTMINPYQARFPLPRTHHLPHLKYMLRGLPTMSTQLSENLHSQPLCLFLTDPKA
jgi:hypothetical protein